MFSLRIFCFLLFVRLHAFSANAKEYPAEAFHKIDEIVEEAIEGMQFPGCQVYVLKDGEQVFNKSYGYLTYDSLQEVTENTLYDLASITKVAATTLMIMDLYEQEYLNLDDPISCFLPEYEGSNKASITVRQLLAHNGKLRSYLPFWEQTLGGDFINAESSPAPTELFGCGQVVDSVKNWIIKSPLGRFRGRSLYRYSDLGFMILKDVAEQAAGESMENYVVRRFYQPLGLEHMMFNPLKKGVPYANIAPTEFDVLFRLRQVWGEVHDRNAAILGGVSGHAGLFSNSHDLASLMSILIRKSDKIGLKPNVIEEFTTAHFQYNRRGLGFDRKNEHVSASVGDGSFGHKGFTGTMVWIDPNEDLVFVFLSNRVYPNAENQKIVQSKTRERIQDAIYEAFRS